MKKRLKQELRSYLAALGSKGGKARAAKHGSRKLSEWGKLGGRPKKQPTKGNRKGKSKR